MIFDSFICRMLWQATAAPGKNRTEAKEEAAVEVASLTLEISLALEMDLHAKSSPLRFSNTRRTTPKAPLPSTLPSV